MASSEFDIIRTYFNHSSQYPAHADGVVLDNGDDAAVLALPPDKQLVVSVDTLVAGVHFPDNSSPADIAWKAIMVNLSDMAAMGAQAQWLTLALTLPAVDQVWLKQFASQFHELLAQQGVRLVGGDTTQGGLAVTVQAMGMVNNGMYMRRSAARPGDDIYVTGFIGDAAIGLDIVLHHKDDEQVVSRFQNCVASLNRPEPPVQFARELVAMCDCAIDISDGLLADLGHILSHSQCGARLYLAGLAISDEARDYFSLFNNNQLNWQQLLTGGDDYQLCFTLAQEHRQQLDALAKRHGIQCSRIGEITDNGELICKGLDGEPLALDQSGFEHFKGN